MRNAALYVAIIVNAHEPHAWHAGRRSARAAPTHTALGMPGVQRVQTPGSWPWAMGHGGQETDRGETRDRTLHRLHLFPFPLARPTRVRARLVAGLWVQQQAAGWRLTRLTRPEMTAGAQLLNGGVLKWSKWRGAARRRRRLSAPLPSPAVHKRCATSRRMQANAGGAVSAMLLARPRTPPAQSISAPESQHDPMCIDGPA